MKALKGLLIFLVILIAVGLLIPVKFRIAYTSYSIGRIQEMTGNSTGASVNYRTATQAMPKEVMFARIYARSLNDLGEKTGNGDYFDQAARFTETWIIDHEGNPDVWQIIVEKARALWGQGRKPAAKEAIEQAVSLNPTSYEALVYEGIMFRDIHPENPDTVRTSIPIFEQAIEIRRRTNTDWAQYELAVAFWMIRDEEQALNHVEQCLSQFPPRDLKERAERLKHEIQSSGRSER